MKAASSRKSKTTGFRSTATDSGVLVEQAAKVSGAASKPGATKPGGRTKPAKQSQSKASAKPAAKTGRGVKVSPEPVEPSPEPMIEASLDGVFAEGEHEDGLEIGSIPALDGGLDDDELADDLDEPDAEVVEPVSDLTNDAPAGLSGSGLTTGPRIRLTPSQLIAEHRVNSPLDRLELDQVWRMYRADPNTELRNYLWQRYLPLVRYNAERVYSRLPDEVDLDNLIQAGSFGLMDAIRSFDLDRGVKFETFCAQRIRGAILDELRSMDWVPRLVRHRTSRVEQVRERMRAQHGIRPTSEEIAKELGCDEEEVKKVLKDGHAVSMSSLSKQRYQSDGSREVREIDVIHDSRQSDPFSEVQRADLKSMLCKGLSRAERLIVVLYYYEGMTMKEIGMTLDLSESRVSQMHTLILQRLKAQMQHREGEFEDDE